MRKTPHKRSLLHGREGLRFAIMILLTIVVAAVAFGSFNSGKNNKEKAPEKISTDALAVTLPPLNKEILAEAKDATAIQRLEAEPSVYEHLLQCTTYIVPGVLQAMGLQSPSVKALQENPRKWRGKPVALQGTVIDLRPPATIPGIEAFKKTEGMLQTESGKHVFFAVLDRVPTDLGLGHFVRIEGFFFKLRDFKFPNKYDHVPHVVGFKLRKGFRHFETVRKLDPKVLAKVHDEVERPAEINKQALYHLSSWVLYEAKHKKLEAQAVELERKDAVAMLNATGEVPRGKVFRVLAELYDLQVRLAEPNPLGIRYWTRAWVRHPNQETIQVNIPGRIEGVWHTGDFVLFHGAFLQRLWYQAGMDDQGQRHERIVPLLVAAKLQHWKLIDNPDNLWVRLGLGAITLLLIAVVAFLVFRDRKAEQEVRKHLLAQRQKRRRSSRQ